MQVQNKLNATVFEMVINNFRGIETFAHKFEKGKPLIAYGENGAGKTAIIISLYAALDKRKIPIKYDSLVGPYSIENIKKAKVRLGIEGDKGILELNGKTLEKFYVNFSETEKGTVNLSLTDAITGEVDKSPSREKIKNLIGLFLDPVDLANTLEEPKGDRKLAEKLAKMVGLDLQPYIDKENALFEEKQEENVTLKRLRGELSGMDVPQDDWATEKIDQKTVSDEIQLYTTHEKENSRRSLNIETAKEGLKDHQLDLLKLESSKTDGDELILSGSEALKKEHAATAEVEKSITLYKDENPIVEPEKTPEEITVQIEALQKELKSANVLKEKNRNIVQKITDMHNDVVTRNKLSFQSGFTLEGKKADLNVIIDEIKIRKEKVPFLETEITKVSEANMPIPWKGKRDPEGLMEVLQHLNDLMSKAETNNKQVDDRVKYFEKKEGIDLVEESIKDLDKNRKDNTDDKLFQISKVDFPMEGISVDENTVWYDSEDGRGKQTIIDRSEGEKMRVCTHILIAGNTGPLNVLVIRQGHALSKKSQHIIFEVAAEYGYTVILETVISDEPGAVLIEAGNAKSIIPSKAVEDKEEVQATDSPKKTFNW